MNTPAERAIKAAQEMCDQLIYNMTDPEFGVMAGAHSDPGKGFAARELVDWIQMRLTIVHRGEAHHVASLLAELSYITSVHGEEGFEDNETAWRFTTDPQDLSAI